MKLTVLGNYGPYPRAGGACSGYLIEDGSTKIILDFGNGVLSRLQKFIDIEEIDAIILSHLHSDHMSDIMILRYAVDIKMNRGHMEKGIDVYSPSNPADDFERMKYKEAINLIPIDAQKKIKIGELEISFERMEHCSEDYAICITSHGKKFVYSGDTSPNEALVEFAKDADLFLCEAGLLERDEKSMRATHLTAKEAGDIAGRAGVKRLLLTHFWPEFKLEQYLNETLTVFTGMFEIADEMKSYFI